MIERKLLFIAIIYVAKLSSSYPFFAERSEKLTALKVAEEPEESPENNIEENFKISKKNKKKGNKDVDTPGENEDDEVTVEATLGPDSDSENDSDSDLAEPDDPEVVKAKKERTKKKKIIDPIGSDKINEDGEDMNVDPLTDPDDDDDSGPSAYTVTSAGPSAYSDSGDGDEDSSPSAYTTSSSGPSAYTDADSEDTGGAFDDDDTEVNNELFVDSCKFLFSD